MERFIKADSLPKSMDKKLSFRGNQIAKVVNGNLHIPPTIRFFYEMNNDYAVADESIAEHRYLTVAPVEEFKRSLDEHITVDLFPTNRFVPLEKLVVNGVTKGLKLPHHSLRHLGIGDQAIVLISGHLDYFEVWKPDDFRRYRSSIDYDAVTSFLALENIGV